MCKKFIQSKSTSIYSSSLINQAINQPSIRNQSQNMSNHTAADANEIIKLNHTCLLLVISIRGLGCALGRLEPARVSKGST